MKYTYKILKRCHGLRFSATVDNEKVYGIVEAQKDYVALCHGPMTISHLGTFQKPCVFLCTKEEHVPFDIEIIPRDPETYVDWQIGDKASSPEGRTVRMAFRSNDLVVPVYEDSNKAGVIYTCQQLFNMGFRLVLTDIEKKLLKANSHECPKFTMRKGDPVLVRDSLSDVWMLEAFVTEVSDGARYLYKTTNGASESRYNHCIPYNEKTRHLLGTNKKYQ